MKSSSYYSRKADASRELGHWTIADRWAAMAAKARKIEKARKAGRVSSPTWKTYPMGGKGAEYMERRGKVAHMDHAVDTETGRSLCGVRVDFLCLDDSLATDSVPECPKCAARIARRVKK